MSARSRGRLKGGGSTELDDLEVADVVAVDDEAHQGAHLLPALQSGCSRVDVKQAQRGVVLHLEDVRVSANEELGRRGHQASHHAAVVTAGVAADVLHHDVDALAAKANLLGKHAAQVAAVDVAIHGRERMEPAEAQGHLGGADVAGMPNLVDVGKVEGITLVPEAVGVGEQADARHTRKR